MNSLESVHQSLVNYLTECINYDDLFRILVIVNRREFHLKVYEAFFNLIADPNHTPEYILCQLETYISGLDGFATNRAIQTLMAFACFESLAKRILKKLTGAWEKLSWFIIKYSTLTSYEQRCTSQIFEISNPMAVILIQRFSSPKFCPNPCLRLELYKLMRNFYRHLFPDPESFRKNVILTLLELSDNYETLTLDQLTSYRPLDLKSLIKDNNIRMECIKHDDDFIMRKTEIVAAVLFLTKKLALVVKQTSTGRLNDPAYKQLYPCFTFCGLVPTAPAMDLDYDLICFVETVNNYPLLMSYVTDTLETLDEAPLWFPMEDDIKEKIKEMNNRILGMFYKSHINRFPKHLHLQEINGGNNPAMKYHLEYIQNNIIEDDYDLDNYNYAENGSFVLESD